MWAGGAQPQPSKRLWSSWAGEGCPGSNHREFARGTRVGSPTRRPSMNPHERHGPQPSPARSSSTGYAARMNQIRVSTIRDVCMFCIVYLNSRWVGRSLFCLAILKHSDCPICRSADLVQSCPPDRPGAAGEGRGTCRSCGSEDGRLRGGSGVSPRPGTVAEVTWVGLARPQVHNRLDGWGCAPPAHRFHRPYYETENGKKRDRNGGIAGARPGKRDGGIAGARPGKRDGGIAGARHGRRRIAGAHPGRRGGVIVSLVPEKGVDRGWVGEAGVHARCVRLLLS